MTVDEVKSMHNEGFAAIPPLMLEDAQTVVHALRAMADGVVLSLPAERVTRARALADVYEAACNGDAGLAGSIYAAVRVTGGK